MILSELNRGERLDTDNPAHSKLHYTVLDLDELDYSVRPVLFTESNRSPRVLVSIAGFETVLPVDWSILCGDRTTCEVEIVTIRDAIDRGFEAFVYNPWSDRVPSFEPIKLLTTARRFITTKFSRKHILAHALSEVEQPKVVWITKSYWLKEPIQLADLVS